MKLIFSKDLNLKILQSKKIANWGVDRVQKHKVVREKQIDFEEDRKVLQVLVERRKEKQEKDYHKMLKDISEERDFVFKKYQTVRK